MSPSVTGSLPRSLSHRCMHARLAALSQALMVGRTVCAVGSSSMHNPHCNGMLSPHVRTNTWSTRLYKLNDSADNYVTATWFSRSPGLRRQNLNETLWWSYPSRMYQTALAVGRRPNTSATPRQSMYTCTQLHNSAQHLGRSGMNYASSTLVSGMTAVIMHPW